MEYFKKQLAETGHRGGKLVIHSPIFMAAIDSHIYSDRRVERVEKEFLCTYIHDIHSFFWRGV
jgi:hypothetical protein